MSKRGAALVAGTMLAGTALVAAAPLAGAGPVPAGTFQPVNATRLVDTRSGVGLTKAPVGAGRTVTFQAVQPLGTGSASAVELTITAVAPTRSGYLTAYAGATTRPGTSTLNFQPHTTTANSAVVAASSTGTVSVYNGSTGTVSLVVDATGYWTPGTVDPATAGALQTVTPQRILDTRTSGGAIPAGGDRSVPIAGVGPVPATGVSAVVLNATVATPAAAGFLSVVPVAETPDERTSVVNFTARASRADLAIVAVNSDGTISLHNGSTAPLSAALDITGYVIMPSNSSGPEVDGTLFNGPPFRAYDDRVAPATAIDANGSRAYTVFNGGNAIFESVVATVTVVGATAPGYVVAANGDTTMSHTSSLNHAARQTVAQTLVLPINADGTVVLRNASSGTVRLVIDITAVIVKPSLDPTITSGPDNIKRIQSILGRARHAASARLGH